MSEKQSKGNVAAIAIMFALFFMIAFVTNFAGSMGIIVKNQFGASNMASQLGSAANFFAYFFMGKLFKSERLAEVNPKDWRKLIRKIGDDKTENVHLLMK